MSLKARLRRMLPVGARYFYTRVCARKTQRQYGSLALAEAFTKVYESGAWGSVDAEGMPNSGLGSRGEYVAQWCSFIDAQFRNHGVASVADLGCGDLLVGTAMARMGYIVTGVDVADPVASWSQRRQGKERVRFVHADLTKDQLPGADAAILRQVLQHLTNSEVKAALANIQQTYPLVFITEHVYTGPGCVPNIDMPHGPGTRVPMLSGVFIDQPPFNVHARKVGDIPVGPREVLRTWAVENGVPQR